MLMGNTMSCFERWGKRGPDGPLLQIKGKGLGASGIVESKPSALSVSTQSTTAGTTSPTPATQPPQQQGAPESAGPAAPAAVDRPSRRRQTYSSKSRKSDTEISSMEEMSDETESEDNDAVSASDIRFKKVMQYRRALTKVVKLKTHLFSETVKVTCSRDGEHIEWFKGKSASGPQDRKKASGFFPVDKITSVKAQADNTKALVITVNNPQPSTYNFTFKTASERESWQEQIESLMKFMAMK